MWCQVSGCECHDHRSKSLYYISSWHNKWTIMFLIQLEETQNNQDIFYCKMFGYHFAPVKCSKYICNFELDKQTTITYE